MQSLPMTSVSNSMVSNRDGLVSKIPTSEGCQCKTIPVPGLLHKRSILVHSQLYRLKKHFSKPLLYRLLTGNETHETKAWQFPLKEIATKRHQSYRNVGQKFIISSD